MTEQQLHDIGLVAANAMANVIIAKIAQKQYTGYDSEQVGVAIRQSYDHAVNRKETTLVQGGLDHA